jgi:hypothetical protein
MIDVVSVAVRTRTLLRRPANPIGWLYAASAWSGR